DLAGCYREVWENRGLHGCHGRVLGWPLTQTPYNLDARFGGPPSTSFRTGPGRALAVLLNHVPICVIRVIRGEVLLRRDGGDDFFEAWMAAQRVPPRIQTQVAVMHSGRDFSCYFELLKCQIAFANPRIDRCQVGYHRRTVQRVFFGEFDRLPALADCLFLSV